MSENLRVGREGAVLTVTFDRPAKRNAMTADMYDGLYAACETADADDGIKVLVLRGAGGRAFVSGTDISSFRDFRDGAAGVAYEGRIARVVNRLEDVTVPTVAAIEGYCVGGGLALAAVCDMRVSARSGRFGMPIARTLGNCLSMNSMSILVAHLGPARTLDLVLRARMLTAEEAHAAGFVAELCDDDALDRALASVVDTLLTHAPLTMWAAKVAVARLRRASLPDGDDFVTRVFGSDDFRRAVAAFGSSGAEERPRWTGR
ncbi:MAG TPA: enoyl-CoA hydratase [Gammaproteobacteria bacterium]|nr:enoyl-CoA hydratase [Gammaproteobacteria bacterium]